MKRNREEDVREGPGLVVGPPHLDDVVLVACDVDDAPAQRDLKAGRREVEVVGVSAHEVRLGGEDRSAFGTVDGVGGAGVDVGLGGSDGDWVVGLGGREDLTRGCAGDGDVGLRGTGSYRASTSRRVEAGVDHAGIRV